MGRPKVEVDEEVVRKLAGLNCSLEEIGLVAGCSVDTLGRRFAEAIKKGRAEGHVSLKRKQFEVAMKGNVSMLIWLGKIMLGQRDNSYDVKLFAQEVQGLTDEQLTTLAKKKLDEIASA